MNTYCLSSLPYIVQHFRYEGNSKPRSHDRVPKTLLGDGDICDSHDEVGLTGPISQRVMMVVLMSMCTGEATHAQSVLLSHLRVCM